MIPPLFKHQEDDIQFINNQNRVLNFSDAGTGKTRTTIEVIKHRKQEGRTLILCPKSIMYPTEDSVGYTIQEEGSCVGKKKAIDLWIIQDLIKTYSK